MTPQNARALRRSVKCKLARRWLRRIKAKRWKRQQGLAEQQLDAVKRTESHENIRNHCRKTCSYCNPKFRYHKQERQRERDFATELLCNHEPRRCTVCDIVDGLKCSID